jgi:hypothetical protein
MFKILTYLSSADFTVCSSSDGESEILRERPTEETLVVCRYKRAWRVCSKKAKNARPARRVKGSKPDLKKKYINLYTEFCVFSQFKF